LSPGSPPSQARSITAIAPTRRWSTTAQGVETENELKIVCELGCDKIQGFFFGRPMEATDTLNLFRQRHVHNDAVA
jgi:EAL domain-containing protein (putative c-di-GMP-specific phosphodiesterase class I)